MQELIFTGGAHIGWMNASWPFARLNISSKRLLLNSFGRYEFSPEQIVSLEPYGVIPVLMSGIRIHHCHPQYPERMIFWCIGNRDKTLMRIAQSGFLPAHKVRAKPAGLAIRWEISTAVFLLWAAMFFLDTQFHISRGGEDGPGLLRLISLLAVFAFSTAARTSGSVQERILNPGHQYGEIKPQLRFLQWTSGICSLVYGLVYLLGFHRVM
ncbi:hypothetical protein [Undibacterium sp. TJN19]|uniref:hypothetical protein n=1 Tax=Undibacterium sp. TJN19 TaxID=3413055 RepID=UPI003BF44E92